MHARVCVCVRACVCVCCQNRRYGIRVILLLPLLHFSILLRSPYKTEQTAVWQQKVKPDETESSLSLDSKIMPILSRV